MPFLSLMCPLAERSRGRGCPCCRPPGSRGAAPRGRAGVRPDRVPARVWNAWAALGVAGPVSGSLRREGPLAGHWVGGEGVQACQAAQHPGRGVLERQGRAEPACARQPANSRKGGGRSRRNCPAGFWTPCHVRGPTRWRLSLQTGRRSGAPPHGGRRDGVLGPRWTARASWREELGTGALRRRHQARCPRGQLTHSDALASLTRRLPWTDAGLWGRMCGRPRPVDRTGPGSPRARPRKALLLLFRFYLAQTARVSHVQLVKL